MAGEHLNFVSTVLSLKWRVFDLQSVLDFLIRRQSPFSNMSVGVVGLFPYAHTQI